MQKVLTAAEMREVDRLTTEKYGIPSLLLMENAAHAVARVITEKLGGSVKGKSVLILCGKGNNGGDGAALARILWTLGADVNVCLMFPDEQFRGDAKQNLSLIRKLHAGQIPFREPSICITEVGAHRVFFDNWDSYFNPDVVVDALFGTGLTKPLNNEHTLLAKSFGSMSKIENRPMYLSIDLPSGLNADNRNFIGECIRADVTVAFTSPKPANVLPPASNLNGELIIANIGSPQELIDQQPSQLYLAEREDATRWLESTKFTENSYKNKRGHALLIAGSADYTGAAVMCGNAAMRSGVGLVTLHVPESCKTEIASRSLPEVIVRAINENDNGELSENAFSEMEEQLNSADAIAVGCGLSATDRGVERLVRRIVETRNTPVIVDAGALWFFNPPEDIPISDKVRPPLIFTPHEGEFMRLLGADNKEAIKDRVAAVRDFSVKNNVILVLKGERVLIGEPGGKVVVNPTGNSGLGKAGNGDTLTGILVGFTAQAAKMKIDIFETVIAAVYIAGIAGDIAEKKYGKRVMTASDARECLHDAFEHLISI